MGTGHLPDVTFLALDSALVSSCEAWWPGPLWGVGSHGVPDPTRPPPLSAQQWHSVTVGPLSLPLS